MRATVVLVLMIAAVTGLSPTMRKRLYRRVGRGLPLRFGVITAPAAASAGMRVAARAAS